MAETDHIKEHISRCIELYAPTIDTDFAEEVTRSAYEQMRSDLLICVGMMMTVDVVRPPRRSAGETS